MKKIIFLTILGGIFVLSGCGQQVLNTEEIDKQDKIVVEEQENNSKPTSAKVTEDKQQIAKNEEGSNNEINTSDWQIYRNEKYGFEIKYPNNFIDQNPYVSFSGLVDNEISIVKTHFRKNQNINDLASDIYKTVQQFGSVKSDEIVNLGNASARKIVLLWPVGKDEGIEYIYYIEKGEDVIEISWGYYEKEDIKNIEAMLKSFKLIGK